MTLGSNSPFADANGNIYVQPGDHIPMVPHNRFKLGGDYSVTKQFKVGADLLVVGSQYYAGDGSNQFQQLPAYAVVDADASYQVTANVQVYLRVNNVFDNHYYTYGTFFDTTQIPNFGASAVVGQGYVAAEGTTEQLPSTVAAAQKRRQFRHPR